MDGHHAYRVSLPCPLNNDSECPDILLWHCVCGSKFKSTHTIVCHLKDRRRSSSCRLNVMHHNASDRPVLLGAWLAAADAAKMDLHPSARCYLFAASSKTFVDLGPRFEAFIPSCNLSFVAPADAVAPRPRPASPPPPAVAAPKKKTAVEHAGELTVKHILTKPEKANTCMLTMRQDPQGHWSDPRHLGDFVHQWSNVLTATARAFGGSSDRQWLWLFNAIALGTDGRASSELALTLAGVQQLLRLIDEEMLRLTRSQLPAQPGGVADDWQVIRAMLEELYHQHPALVETPAAAPSSDDEIAAKLFKWRLGVARFMVSVEHLSYRRYDAVRDYEKKLFAELFPHLDMSSLPTHLFLPTVDAVRNRELSAEQRAAGLGVTSPTNDCAVISDLPGWLSATLESPDSATLHPQWDKALPVGDVRHFFPELFKDVPAPDDDALVVLVRVGQDAAKFSKHTGHKALLRSLALHVWWRLAAPLTGQAVSAQTSLAQQPVGVAWFKDAETVESGCSVANSSFGELDRQLDALSRGTHFYARRKIKFVPLSVADLLDLCTHCACSAGTVCPLDLTPARFWVDATPDAQRVVPLIDIDVRVGGFALIGELRSLRDRVDDAGEGALPLAELSEWSSKACEFIKGVLPRRKGDPNGAIGGTAAGPPLAHSSNAYFSLDSAAETLQRWVKHKDCLRRQPAAVKKFIDDFDDWFCAVFSITPAISTAMDAHRSDGFRFFAPPWLKSVNQIVTDALHAFPPLLKGTTTAWYEMLPGTSFAGLVAAVVLTERGRDKEIASAESENVLIDKVFQRNAASDRFTLRQDIGTSSKLARKLIRAVEEPAEAREQLRRLGGVHTVMAVFFFTVLHPAILQVNEKWPERNMHAHQLSMHVWQVSLHLYNKVGPMENEEVEGWRQRIAGHTHAFGQFVMTHNAHTALLRRSPYFHIIVAHLADIALRLWQLGRMPLGLFASTQAIEHLNSSLKEAWHAHTSMHFDASSLRTVLTSFVNRVTNFGDYAAVKFIHTKVVDWTCSSCKGQGHTARSALCPMYKKKKTGPPS